MHILTLVHAYTTVMLIIWLGHGTVVIYGD